VFPHGAGPKRLSDPARDTDLLWQSEGCRPNRPQRRRNRHLRRPVHFHAGGVDGNSQVLPARLSTSTAGTRERPGDLRRSALHRMHHQAGADHMPCAAGGPVHDDPGHRVHGPPARRGPLAYLSIAAVHTDHIARERAEKTV
jgi:hypothetical protein